MPEEYETTCPNCQTTFDVQADAEETTCPSCAARILFDPLPEPEASVEASGQSSPSRPPEAGDANERSSGAGKAEATPGKGKAKQQEQQDKPSGKTRRQAFLRRARTQGADVPVETVEGIGPTYGKRLGSAGVTTTAALLAADAKELSRRTRIPEREVRKWQDMVDLMHLKGIGPQYAEVLVRCDINSVAELAMQDAPRLTGRITAFIDRLQTRPIGVKITQRRVAGWVRAAQAVAPPPPSPVADALAAVESEPVAPQNPVLTPKGIMEAVHFRGHSFRVECSRCEEPFLVARQTRAGACPYCGFALRFKDVTEDDLLASEIPDDARLAQDAKQEAEQGFMERFAKEQEPPRIQRTEAKKTRRKPLFKKGKDHHAGVEERRKAAQRPKPLADVACAHCGHAFRVRPNQKKATCPECHARLALLPDEKDLSPEDLARQRADLAANETRHRARDAKASLRAKKEQERRKAAEARRRGREEAKAKRQQEAAKQAPAAAASSQGPAAKDAKAQDRRKVAEEKRRARAEAAEKKALQRQRRAEEAAKAKEARKQEARLAKGDDPPGAPSQQAPPALQEAKSHDKATQAAAKQAAKEKAKQEAAAAKAARKAKKEAAREKARKDRESAKASKAAEAAKSAKSGKASKSAKQTAKTDDRRGPEDTQTRGLFARLRSDGTKAERGPGRLKKQKAATKDAPPAKAGRPAKQAAGDDEPKAKGDRRQAKLEKKEQARKANAEARLARLASKAEAKAGQKGDGGGRWRRGKDKGDGRDKEPEVPKPKRQKDKAPKDQGPSRKDLKAQQKARRQEEAEKRLAARQQAKRDAEKARLAGLKSDSLWEQAVARSVAHQERKEGVWAASVEEGTGHEQPDSWSGVERDALFGRTAKKGPFKVRLVDGRSPFAQLDEDEHEKRPPRLPDGRSLFAPLPDDEPQETPPAPRLPDGRSPFEKLPEDERPDYSKLHAFGHKPGEAYTTRGGFRVVEEVVETEAPRERSLGAQRRAEQGKARQEAAEAKEAAKQAKKDEREALRRQARQKKIEKAGAKASKTAAASKATQEKSATTASTDAKSKGKGDEEVKRPGLMGRFRRSQDEEGPPGAEAAKPVKVKESDGPKKKAAKSGKADEPRPRRAGATESGQKGPMPGAGLMGRLRRGHRGKGPEPESASDKGSKAQQPVKEPAKGLLSKLPVTRDPEANEAAQKAKAEAKAKRQAEKVAAEKAKAEEKAKRQAEKVAAEKAKAEEKAKRQAEKAEAAQAKARNQAKPSATDADAHEADAAAPGDQRPSGLLARLPLGRPKDDAATTPPQASATKGAEPDAEPQQDAGEDGAQGKVAASPAPAAKTDAQALKEAERKAEADARQKAETEARKEAERKAKQEAGKKAQAEAAKRRAQAARQKEAQRLARQKAKTEAKAQKERLAQEKAMAAAEAKAEREAKRKAETQAKEAQRMKKAQEAERVAAEAQARKHAQRQAKEEAKAKAKAEAAAKKAHAEAAATKGAATRQKAEANAQTKQQAVGPGAGEDADRDEGKASRVQQTPKDEDEAQPWMPDTPAPASKPTPAPAVLAGEGPPRVPEDDAAAGRRMEEQVDPSSKRPDDTKDAPKKRRATGDYDRDSIDDLLRRKGR